MLAKLHLRTLKLLQNQMIEESGEESVKSDTI